MKDISTSVDLNRCQYHFSFQKKEEVATYCMQYYKREEKALLASTFSQSYVQHF